MEIINATLNPNDMGSGIRLSNGNLTVVSTSSRSGVRATHGKINGKWYWEVKFDSGNSVFMVGISNKSFSFSSSSSTWRGYYGANSGARFPENTAYGSGWKVGDIIGVALDLDNGTLEFYKNGVSMGVSHTNVKELGEVYPTFISYTVDAERHITFNFGVTPFAHSMPKGFYSYDGRQYGNYNKFLILTESNDAFSYLPQKITTESVIPKMTGNTTPSGRAFAESVYSSAYDYSAWKAFNQTDESEGYASATNKMAGYLGYEFPEKKIISKYAVRSGSSSSFLNRLPKSWTFEGSNDEVVWDILDTQTNQTWTTVNTDKEYLISNATFYKMYRIKWSENNAGSGYTNMNGFKMYENVLGELVEVESSNENNFINHGMDAGTEVNLNSLINKVNYFVSASEPLDSGRVFRQKIDTLKKPIKNVSIK